MDTTKDTTMQPVTDAVIEELRNRLEAAEKDVALKERVIDALGSELNAVANEHDALRAKIAEAEENRSHFLVKIGKLYAQCDALHAKIEQMERQKPVGKFTQHPSNGLWEQDGYGDNPEASPLYALPGAQNIPEKLCYDSRWEISIDYVDGWNAAVDMMRGKSPSWHCPDCCIAFPFGAPKSCPNDDARCNSLLAAAPEAKP